MEIHCVLCKVGRYDVAVINDDEFVGHTARASGVFWEAWIADHVKTYYKEGTDILDIGANIGTHTLMFSEIGPVHSFEPMYHQVLKKNLELNTLDNPVKIYAHALSDTNDTKNMFLPLRMPYGLRNYGGTSMHMNETCKHENTAVPVECKTLDSVYDGVPSIIKLDVENHELYVLKGAINTIKMHKPTIFIEITDYETSEVRKLLEDFGYGDPIALKDKNYIYTYDHKSSPNTVLTMRGV